MGCKVGRFVLVAKGGPPSLVVCEICKFLVKVYRVVEMEEAPCGDSVA